MSTPLPLQGYPFVRTYSLEEAQHIQASLNAPIDVDYLQRGAAFSWEANRVPLGRLGVMASRYGGGIRARSRAFSQQFSLIVPVRNGGRMQQEGTTVEMQTGKSAIMCSPAWPIEFAMESDYESRAIGVPPHVVERTLDALTGATRSAPLRFEPAVDMRGPGAAVRRLLEFIVSEADREDAVLSSPLVESRLEEALVCALLSRLPHNYSHLFEPATAKYWARWWREFAFESNRVFDASATTTLPAP